MLSMNRRPRRLLAPGLAVAAVTVLVVVLIVTGRTLSPRPHRAGATTPPGQTTHPDHRRHNNHDDDRHRRRRVGSAELGTRQRRHLSVADRATFTLVLSATSGECWIERTQHHGAALFTGVLTPARRHTVPATGPISVIVGAPSAFAATVNGAPVTLPTGFQTPLTLKFDAAAARPGDSELHRPSDRARPRTPSESPAAIPRASSRKACTRASSFQAS